MRADFQRAENCFGRQIHGLHFLAIDSIFGDMLDFLLASARLLVTELPGYTGMAPSSLQVFIFQSPFRCTFQVPRGQNLGCLERVVF